MTAATLAPASLKTRLQQVINYAISGTYEAGACVCGEDDCTHVEETRKVLDIMHRAIDRAPVQDGMLAIYSECWFWAAGIPESEWSVSVTPAVNGGVR